MLKFMSIKKQMFAKLGTYWKSRSSDFCFHWIPILANSRWFERIHSVFWYRNSTVSGKSQLMCFQQRRFFPASLLEKLDTHEELQAFELVIIHWISVSIFSADCAEKCPRSRPFDGVLMGSQHLKKGLRRLHLKDPSIQHTTLRINRFIRPRNSCFFWGGKLLLSSWIRDCQDFRILVTCDDLILSNFYKWWVCNNHPLRFVKNFRSCWTHHFFHPLRATFRSTTGTASWVGTGAKPVKKLWGSWE